jgi:hypothetical protein
LQSLLKIARLGSRLERQEVVEDKAGVGRAFAIIAARAALAGRAVVRTEAGDITAGVVN